MLRSRKLLIKDRFIFFEVNIMTFKIGDQVHIKDIGRYGIIVIAIDRREKVVKYLVELSYPYSQKVFSEDEMRLIP